MTGDFCVFKFFWLNADEKYLMRFQSLNVLFQIAVAQYGPGFKKRCAFLNGLELRKPALRSK